MTTDVKEYPWTCYLWRVTCEEVENADDGVEFSVVAPTMKTAVELAYAYKENILDDGGPAYRVTSIIAVEEVVAWHLR